MNRLVSILAAALLATIVVMVAGFSVLQSEINSLKPQTPTIPPPSMPPATLIPTISPSPTVTPRLRYNYTVFEWTLKSQYVGNVTWLSTVGFYNASKTWVENYVYLISRNGGSAFPAQMRDSLAASYFAVPAFVNVEFNEQTGFTKVTYLYLEQDLQPYLYTVETSLFFFVKDTAFAGWREYFV